MLRFLFAHSMKHEICVDRNLLKVRRHYRIIVKLIEEYLEDLVSSFFFKVVFQLVLMFFLTIIANFQPVHKHCINKGKLQFQNLKKGSLNPSELINRKCTNCISGNIMV